MTPREDLEYQAEAQLGEARALITKALRYSRIGRDVRASYILSDAISAITSAKILYMKAGSK